MSGFQRLRRFFILIVIAALTQPIICTYAQDIPAAKQSVIVFDVKLDRLFESAKTLGGDLNQLDATMPMENVFESIKPSEFKRVYGSLSLPDSVEKLMGLGRTPKLPFEFYVRIEFANVDACRMMTENIEDLSTEVELEGKKYWTPKRSETGVYGHRLNDTTFEFGSEAYLVQAERNFLTPALSTTWNSAPDEAFRIAADLASPSDFIAQAVAMGNESGDVQVQAYLELIDNLKTIVVTADAESKNLLTFIANAKDAEQALEVKEGLDSLLMLAQMGGKMAVGQLSKEIPEAGALAGKMLDSLAATQNDSVVKIAIPKPEGFAEAVPQIIEAAKKQGNEVAEVNNFRQVGLAILNYDSAYERFPFDVTNDEGQNNDLSWRVRVLPFLEQNAMFQQMDVSAGPTDEANSQFADKMPSVLGGDGKLSNVVRIQSQVNGFGDILDGSSNTIMLIEYPKGQPWLENGSVSIEDAIELVTGLPDGEELIIVFYDCSTRKLTNKVDKETLMKLFDPADGNIIEGFFDRD